VSNGDVLRLHAWHQRTSPIDARERLLAALAPAPTRVLLATCHRVESYDLGDADLVLSESDRAAATILTGRDALAHLIAVSAGLDSAIAGESQIHLQIRRTYLEQRPMHPMLHGALELALFAGRAVRHDAGFTSSRSVGSLAVDRLVGRLVAPASARVLVIGAGEMGKLAVRALARRVGAVLIANRDIARAREVAAAHGATAIALADVPDALATVDGVISAADTRGALLSLDVLGERVRRGTFVVVDIAVPRSVDADARALLGASYLSVDDLPAGNARAAPETLARAHARCRDEADAFFRHRAPERVAAIRALREEGERLRVAKLRRALGKLAHLPEHDRRVVEALSTSITNALLHAPTVELRDR